MYQIEYLPSALHDLTDIAYYIGVNLQNPLAADNLAEKIVASVEKLTEMPYKYAVYYPIKPLQREHRKMVVGKYLVFYWIDESLHKITVARVIYGGRQIEEILD